ncbi:nucleoside triphosphatase i [Pacmanvirus S19]|nr:nucleoside triphosphatase i [Pacmanvirus S19]
MQKDTHKYLTKLDRNNTSFTLQLFEYFKNNKWGHEYDFLKYYQNIARMFVNDVEIDSRGLLCTLQMGLGKSILAISIAMDLMKERQPIILLTKSLQENMRGAIVKYVNLRKSVEPDYYLGRLSEMELAEWIDRNFSFVSMNASNMLKQMGKAAEGKVTEEFDAALEKKFGEVLKLATLDGKLLIVDEAHNLFRAITNGSKNGIGLYDLVMKAKNLKVMFFTGTPIANDPFELVPCFNMLGSKFNRPTLPENYSDFKKLFVDEKNGRIKNKEKFQNRILGLVSYVSHLSNPGKAFGISDVNTKAEFPEEKPTVVERVHMDPEQYVVYQLARDKEQEEGSGSKFTSNRVQETPSMTKPKSKAASTYRVKSRQLSNFCAPAAFREEKDPSKIPEQYLGAAKYRKMVENIDKHKDQLGIVYSQFVGMGGLGTLKRYLNSLGWKEVHISAKVKKDPKEAVKELLNEPPGEQGELDEYIDDLEIAPKITDTEDTSDTEDYEGEYEGSYLASADAYLRNVDRELRKSEKWWTGSDEYLGSYENSEHRKFGCLDSESDTEDMMNILDSVIEPNNKKTNITFKYATESDIGLLNEIDPEYVHNSENIKYPKYILIVFEDEKPIGYIIIEYTIKDDDPSNIQCDGTILKDNLTKLSHNVARDVLMKILLDSIKCGSKPGEFKKAIWGGSTIDIRGAAPAARPDRTRYYAVISGEVEVEDRTRIQNMYNNDDNKHGGILDLILLSSTGAEGLDLKNVRHIHVMEPYWNWGRIKQIIARGVRNDSHKALPPAEKNVQPYIYLAVPPDSERLPTGELPATTDTELYNESIVSQVTIESFNEALHEVSIECMVNGEEFCRVCNPSNQPLYSDDVARDVRATDPCSQVQETQIKAEEIIVDDVKYYYIEDPSSIYDYKVFIYDSAIDGYRALLESDSRYIKIIEAIEANKSQKNKK